ncbi:MAG: hypothetical protein RLZZ127_1262 [Planctomycetota bacterium]
MDDCLIIGAGLAGLACARRLDGCALTILDKGRGVGGRMATRRTGAGSFDTGAQFFSARSPAFRAEVAAWQAAGACRPWSDAVLGPDLRPVADGLVRYRGDQGMVRIPKLLAEGLPVRTGVEVQALAVRDGAWTATAADGTAWSARALVCTAPVPQTLRLLARGGTALPEPAAARLAAVVYEPCLGLLLDYPAVAAAALPAPGALRCDDEAEPVRWILSHRAAGMRREGEGLTVHLRGAWSAVRYPPPEAPDEPLRGECWAAARDAVGRWLGPGWADPAVVELKRWKFAHCTNPLPETCLGVDCGAPLVLAGDAFGDAPRVEGAWLSGTAAADAVRAAIG